MKLPSIQAKPPCPPRMFKKVVKYLSGVLAGIVVPPAQEEAKVGMTPKSRRSVNTYSSRLWAPGSTPSKKRTHQEASEADTSLSEDKSKRQKYKQSLPTPSATPDQFERTVDANPESPTMHKQRPPSSTLTDVLPAWVAPTASHLSKKFSLPLGAEKDVCSGVVSLFRPTTTVTASVSLDPPDLSTSEQYKTKAHARDREKKLPGIVVAVACAVCQEISRRDSGREVDIRSTIRTGVQELVARKIITGMAFGGAIADGIEVFEELKERQDNDADRDGVGWLNGIEEVAQDPMEIVQVSHPRPKFHPVSRSKLASQSQKRHAISGEPASNQQTHQAEERNFEENHELQKGSNTVEDDGDHPASMLDSRTKKGPVEARSPFTHPSIDWLSAERRKHFATWRAGIMRRIQAMERLDSRQKVTVA